MYFKGFTHDLCSPIQGGKAVWNGELPYVLPKVQVDKSNNTCASGWNACKSIEDVFKIVGYWPNGRPTRVFEVKTKCEVFERENKVRAASWNIVREVSEDEVADAVRTMSTCFGEHAKTMVREQLTWRRALGRPKCNKNVVITGLHAALEARGLQNWELQEYSNARDARDAWDARAAWVAWDAWDALTLQYAALNGWVQHDPMLLTTGIRDAYENGLEIAIPVGNKVLGWSMER